MGIEVALEVLPTGLPVSATLEPVAPWSPGEVPQLPKLLSFRQLLREQYPRELRGGPPAPTEAVAEAAEASRPLKRKLAPPAEEGPGLSGIGRRDLLGEAIRSMENRLARQGLLAAPESILSSKPSRQQKGGEFYDVNDNFIDDEELAAVNAYHTEQQEKQKTGRKTLSATRAELDLARPAATTTEEEQAFLAGFRLTGAEVSGTSEESDWSSDNDQVMYAGQRGHAWRRDSRSWLQQLSELKELMPVDAKPSLASPKEGDTGELPLTEEECLSRIKAVLTEFCEAVDAGDRATGRLEICAPDKLEGALAGVCRRLPPLLRMPLKAEEQVQVGFAAADGAAFNRRFKRFALKNLEPKLPQLRKTWEMTAAEDQVDPFAWSSAEEYAWCCYCWRLLASMSPRLRRSHFTRRWLSAVRQPQQEAVELVQQELAVRVRKAISAHESASTDKSKDPSVWTSSALRKGSLTWPAMALQTLWLRNSLWREQHTRKKVRAIFHDADSDLSSRKTEVVQHQHKILSQFIAGRFDLLGLKVDKDTLVKVLSSRGQALPKAQSKTTKKEDSKKEEPKKSRKPNGYSDYAVGQWVEILRQGERPGFGRNATIVELPGKLHGDAKAQLRVPGGSPEEHPLKRLKSAYLWKKGDSVQAHIEGKWEVGYIMADVSLPPEGRVSSTQPVTVQPPGRQAKPATVDFQHVRRIIDVND